MYRSPIDILIQQGFMIKESDDKFKGEDWQLPELLRKAHDITHSRLLEAHNEYQKALGLKLNSEEKLAQKDRETIHLMSQLEDYIDFSREKSDDDSDDDSFLRMYQNLPDDEEEVLSILRRNTIPGLDNWDGTEREIPESMKDDIKNQADDFAEAIDEDKRRKNTLDNKAGELQVKKIAYERQLSLIRSWLYTNLPNWRYDERLGLYGFKPLYEKDNPIPDKITDVEYNVDRANNSIHLKWPVTENTRRYEVYRSIDGGQFEKVYEFDNPQYDDEDVEKGHEYSYKVRALSRWSKGSFSDEINIDF